MYIFAMLQRGTNSKNYGCGNCCSKDQFIHCEPFAAPMGGCWEGGPEPPARRRCPGMKQNRGQKGEREGRKDKRKESNSWTKTQQSGMLGKEQETLDFLSRVLELNIFLAILTGSHMGLDITICLLRWKSCLKKLR